MKRLLSIELQKITKNRSSKVLTIIYFLLLSLITLIASIEFDLGPIHINVAEQGIFNEDSKVVLILPDHGSRYMEKIYCDEWMKEQGFFDSQKQAHQEVEFIK